MTKRYLSQYLTLLWTWVLAKLSENFESAVDAQPELIGYGLEFYRAFEWVFE